MKTAPAFEFPEEEARIYRKAVIVEWITVAYIVSAAIALFVTMGSSQAMRTSFFEDVISIVPALVFLVAGRIALSRPNKEYPYGRHGAVSVGYLTASLALCAMGLFLLLEGGLKLIHQERTTIGGMEVFGRTIWAGWPMLAALVYTAVPSVILGHIKMKLAPKLHDKILYADAQMMKADWMAETATAIGVIGVGLGFWWLDPLAAVIVSAEILKDGVTNLKVAVSDIIERRPRKTDRSGYETLPDRLRRAVKGLDWVEDAEVRLRECGHVFFGEVFLVARSGTSDLPGKVEEVMRVAGELDWRLHDITVTPLKSLKPGPEGDEART